MRDDMLTTALLYLERRGRIFRRTDAAGVVRWVDIEYLPRAAIQRQREQGFDAEAIASRLGLAVPLVRQVLDAPHRGRPAP